MIATKRKNRRKRASPKTSCQTDLEERSHAKRAPKQIAAIYGDDSTEN